MGKPLGSSPSRPTNSGGPSFLKCIMVFSALCVKDQQILTLAASQESHPYRVIPLCFKGYFISYTSLPNCNLHFINEHVMGEDDLE